MVTGFAEHLRQFRSSWERGRKSRASRLTVEPLEGRSLLAGDMVLEWNRALLDAVRVDRTTPPLAARNMAIVQAAVYDAVNAIDRSYEPYFVDVKAPRSASPEAAAAAAAHRALVALYPAQAVAFDAQLTASLAAIPDGPAEDKGVRLGERSPRRSWIGGAATDRTRSPRTRRGPTRGSGSRRRPTPPRPCCPSGPRSPPSP